MALTGFFPTEYGLYFTTVLMSVGFHYFETLKQSLSLQWFSRQEAPQMLGRLIAVGAITSLVTYGVLWICLEVLNLDYVWNLVISGGICIGLAVFMWLGFPEFKTETQQTTRLVLRKRYWLYYGLTFFSERGRESVISPSGV